MSLNYDLASFMAFKDAADEGRKIVMILPVGPVSQKEISRPRTEASGSTATSVEASPGSDSSAGFALMGPSILSCWAPCSRQSLEAIRSWAAWQTM